MSFPPKMGFWGIDLGFSILSLGQVTYDDGVQ